MGGGHAGGRHPARYAPPPCPSPAHLASQVDILGVQALALVGQADDLILQLAVGGEVRLHSRLQPLAARLQLAVGRLHLLRQGKAVQRDTQRGQLCATRSWERTYRHAACEWLCPVLWYQLYQPASAGVARSYLGGGGSLAEGCHLPLQLGDALLPGAHIQAGVLHSRLQLADALEGQAAHLLGGLTCTQGDSSVAPARSGRVE